MMLPPLVAKLIPRLGSDHDGEVIATRDAIVRALAAVGLDLHDLAACIFTVPDPGRRPFVPSSFGDLARACRDLDQGQLTPRERGFVAQMCRLGFGGHPSQRQADWLASIFAKLHRRAA